MNYFAYKLKDDEEVYIKKAPDITTLLSEFTEDTLYKLEKVAELEEDEEGTPQLFTVNLDGIDGMSFYFVMFLVNLKQIDDLKERIG